MFEKLKETLLGKKNEYNTQLASYDYCQTELEYCYKKAGKKNNVIITDDVKLVDEPKNKYDPNAIAVFLYNVKIGYIPSVDTSLVRNLKQKEKPIIRLYFSKEKYRAELTIAHR